ncbi:MAG: EAL domain-containing protein, partial [Kofleriaceae bacterium]
MGAPAGSPPDTPEMGLAELEVAFDRAIKQNHIWMAFQPIVHAKQHALFGYEALMRSRDPQLTHVGLILDAADRLERTTQL